MARCNKFTPPGYEQCTRVEGHEGPCAHPFDRKHGPPGTVSPVASERKERGEVLDLPAYPHLKQLGSERTEYPKTPEAAVLETFANPHPGKHYTVKHETGEFTSLCPKTGQPDFAEVSIEFGPLALCVESKSLKLYLFSFRSTGAFMEDICNRICNDLAALMDPTWMTVRMKFGARGGITTGVEAYYEHKTRPLVDEAVLRVRREMREKKIQEEMARVTAEGVKIGEQHNQFLADTNDLLDRARDAGLLPKEDEKGPDPTVNAGP